VATCLKAIPGLEDTERAQSCGNLDKRRSPVSSRRRSNLGRGRPCPTSAARSAHWSGLSWLQRSWPGWDQPKYECGNAISEPIDQ